MGLACSLACAVWLVTPVASAIPARTAWVTDPGGSLTSAQRATLDDELDAFAKRAGDQVAVVVLPTLEGASIEDASYEIARAWKVGQREKDNGVVLVVAIAEHKSRIEVGKGLGHVLTDIECAEILDGVLRPKLRAGQTSDAVTDGTRAILHKLEPGGAWPSALNASSAWPSSLTSPVPSSVQSSKPLATDGKGTSSSTRVETQGDVAWWKRVSTWAIGALLFVSFLSYAFGGARRSLRGEIARQREELDAQRKKRDEKEKKISQHKAAFPDDDLRQAYVQLDGLTAHLRRRADMLDPSFFSLVVGASSTLRALEGAHVGHACTTALWEIDRVLADATRAREAKAAAQDALEQARRSTETSEASLESAIRTLDTPAAHAYEREAIKALKNLRDEVHRQARSYDEAGKLLALVARIAEQRDTILQDVRDLRSLLAGQKRDLAAIDATIAACEPQIEAAEAERRRVIALFPGEALGPSPAKLLTSLKSLRHEVERRLGDERTAEIQRCAKYDDEAKAMAFTLVDSLKKLPELASTTEKTMAARGMREQLDRERREKAVASRASAPRATSPGSVVHGSSLSNDSGGSFDSSDTGSSSTPDLGSSGSADAGTSGYDGGSSGGYDGGSAGGDSGASGGSGGSTGGGDFGGGGASSDW